MLPDLFDSGVPRSQSDALAAFYVAAQARLRKMILNPTGGKASGQAFRRGRASEHLRQVESEILKLKKGVAAWIGSNVPAAMREGLRHADRQAREAKVRVSGRALQGSFSLIDRRAVELLAKDSYKAADAIGDRAGRVFRAIANLDLGTAQVKSITDGKNMPKTRPAIQRALELKINQAIAGGVIEGTPRQTVRQLAQDLTGVFGDTIQIIDKNGDPEEWDVKKYTDLVVRTRTREVMQSARHQRLEELGIDLVVVHGLVSDNFCSAFLGQVFSLSGKHPKYPPLDSTPGGGPPFHPNCSKSTAPFIEELADDEEIARAGGPASGDSNRLLGMNTTDAQRAFKDLQLRQQVESRYTRSTVTDEERSRRYSTPPELYKITKEEKKCRQMLGAKEIAYQSSDPQWGTDFNDNAKRLQKIQSVNTAIKDLQTRFPNMRSPRVDRMYITSHPTGLAHIGVGNAKEPSMAVANSPSSSEQMSIRLWEEMHGRRWTAQRVDHWTEDNTKHETAHNITTADVLTRWESASKKYTPDWFRKNVSQYAPTTVYEEIAETFTLMTRPDYKRGTLPKEIESVIDHMLGVGGK